MKTTYLITQESNSFLLEGTSGPYKRGLEVIRVKDEPALVEALVTLGVPEKEIATALEDLHTQRRSTVTFTARLMEPL